MPADNPYSVLLAISIASCGVLNVKVVRTGPNISSLAIEYEGWTSVNKVGLNQKPFLGSSHSI